MTGSVSLDSFAGSSALSISGSLAQQSAGTLTAGSYDVRSTDPSHPSVMKWQGADIHVVGADASITLSGAAASLQDSAGQNALRNLSGVDGSLNLEDHSLAVAGNFSNSGQVIVAARTDASSLTIAGTLAQQSAGTLTAGDYEVISSSTDTPGLLSWQGADVHTIGPAAAIKLTGAGASLQDRTGQSALRNLAQVAGDLEITNRDLAVAGNLSNTGSLHVTGNNGSKAKIAIAGNLAQQSSNTLTAGSLSVESDSAADTATLSWQGADLHAIGAGASVSLTGAAASIQDATGQNALRNLATVNGRLSLGGAHLASSSLTVNGTLAVFTADASTLAGSLTLASTATYQVAFTSVPELQHLEFRPRQRLVERRVHRAPGRHAHHRPGFLQPEPGLRWDLRDSGRRFGERHLCRPAQRRAGEGHRSRFRGRHLRHSLRSEQRHPQRFSGRARARDAGLARPRAF